MRVLLDTCVLSELNRDGGAKSVRQAVSELADEAIYLSVVSLGEIAKGVALLEAGARQRRLLSWLNGLEVRYADRLLPVDTETVRVWGEMTARAHRRGQPLPMADGMIAATALRHGLQIMTRNTAELEATGALLVNPW